MAELGFDVLGVDVEPERVSSLSRGILPFHEPGLPELLQKHTATGRLRFTTSMTEAGDFGDVHFIAVGTPQRPGSDAADISFVDAAITELASSITRDSVIIGKSTVPVGTARRMKSIVAEVARADVRIGFGWNPEFLREGFGVEDTLRPDRLVIGAEDSDVIEVMRHIYAEAIGRDTPFICTDFETAELVKVAANAFLATKISFINAFSEVMEVVGGDIRTLADAIGYDARIGRRFLNAGIGFGGGCLPKDIRALQARTSELGLERAMGFLREIDDINLRRRERVLHIVRDSLGELTGKTIAVLGVTFKPNSDDVRDSPALDVASRLHSEGAEVRVYDPKGNTNAAKRFPRLDYRLSMMEAAKQADMVLLLTEWTEFQEMDPQAVGLVVDGRIILDGRNVLDQGSWEDAGWRFLALGLKPGLICS